MLKFKQYQTKFLLAFSVMLFAISTWGEVMVQVMKNDNDFSIAPGHWLAPYSMIACSPDGEKLKSFELDFKGIDSSKIEDVALFSTGKCHFSKSLINFPYDWSNKKCNLKRKQSGKIIVSPVNPLVIPAKLTPQKDFLIGLKLNKNVNIKQFGISIGKFMFSSSEVTPANLSVKCNLDKIPPKIDITSEKIAYSNGVTGVKLKVVSDSMLGYPPHISIEYQWKKNIRNHHTYPVYRYSTSMDKESERVYTFPVLFLERLSDNLKKEKKVTYSCQPAPDKWRWRKDNTGHDLIDGDARTGFVASPGGMRWLYANNVEVIIDLQGQAVIGEVVFYICTQPEKISISVAKQKDGPWTEAAEKKLQLFPSKQLGPNKSPLRASVILENMPEGRYIKASIKCKKSLIISELVVYGLKDKKKILKPKSINVNACDTAGNTTTQKYVIKNN